MTLNNSMSITPMPPQMAKGGRFEHGSVLGGKTRSARVSSQWKSTPGQPALTSWRKPAFVGDRHNHPHHLLERSLRVSLPLRGFDNLQLVVCVILVVSWFSDRLGQFR